MESLFDDVEDDVPAPSDVSSSFEITRQSLPLLSPTSNGNLCKIVPEDDPLKAYYLMARYDGTELSLHVSDGEKTWSGVLSKNTLSELSAATHLNEADHLQDTLTALQQGGGANAAFVFSVGTTSSGSLQLAWKKFLPKENIRFQLGSMILHPAPLQQTHHQLLDFAIDSMRSLRAEVTAVRAEKQRLITERESALHRLEESVSLKEELERDLYGKFKVVLNDKKAKIRKLDQQVEQLLDENARQQQKLQEASAGKTSESGGTGSNRVITGDGSESEEETDEEFGTPTMEVDAAAGPSTSSTTEHAAAQSSLLGGGEEEGHSLPVKRRRRKEVSRTGQPLVIPKPPQRKPVPSKQDSSSSTTSSSKKDSMESDELLNML